MKRAAALFTAAVLAAGAAASAQTPDVSSAIRGGVVLKSPSSLDGAQVSPVRATRGPELGDSMACLRTPGADANPIFIAVFFERGSVLKYRRAIAFDGCATATYAALPAAPAPQPKRNKARPRPRSEATALPRR